MLILVRGLPGSGKSTLCEQLSPDYHFEADDFFMREGVYKFDPSKLGEAHAQCIAKATDALQWSEKGAVTVVSNTFSQRWEMEPYLRAAEKAEVKVFVIDLFDGGKSVEELAIRNVHSVPLTTIQAMARRWEHNWREGDPLPPWERK